MSLVASFAKCSDGLYYEGPWSGDGWFLVLDDDEPPELVVKLERWPELDTEKLTVIREWCKEHVPFFYAMEDRGTAGRLFGSSTHGFMQGHAWFGLLKGFPPPPDSNGQEEWHGCLMGNLCLNAKVQGNVYYPELVCTCGKCRKGWLKNN
jgi:hypothetical protein